MFFKKIFKRRENKMATTLEEVKKAYEDLSDDDKKKFHQTIADRIHESVGEQEGESGTKDEQSAADREHEALGAEHADGEGKTEELGETDTEEEKAHEKAQNKAHEEAKETNDTQDETLKAILGRLDNIEQKLAAYDKKPKEADESTADKLNKLASKFE